MPKVKICGITNEKDAQFAASIGADAIGFVIETPTNSPRNISRELAGTIRENLPLFTSTVGVIMPRTIEKALALQIESGVQFLQIHGNFTSIEIRVLKSRKNIQVIKSIGIGKGADFSTLQSEIETLIENGVDAILLDTNGKHGTGGTGKTHNWSLSADIRNSFDIPIILAGGLNPENVSRALDIVNPFAIDVSSGIEVKPGIKDHKKMRNFIQKVREIS